MKKIGLLFTTVIIMMLFVFSAGAEDSVKYVYSVENGEATIEFANIKISGDVVLPDTLGGYPVKGIADYAFSGSKDLTSVVIPYGVTNIGNGAFGGCTSLESVSLPESLTTIGYAFIGCTKLEYIDIPDSVTYMDYYILNDTAYYNNKDNWTDGILTIDGWLLECMTDYAYISDDVRHIANDALWHEFPIIEYFEVDSNNKCFSSDEYGVLYNKDKTELVYYPYASKNKTYTIPDTVETVILFDTAYLETLVIPESVKIFPELEFRMFGIKDVYIYSDDISMDPDCGICYIYVDQERWCEVRDEIVDLMQEYAEYYVNSTEYDEDYENEFDERVNEIISYIMIDETVPCGTIHANAGSTAEAYARELGINFEVLKGDVTVTDEKTGVSAEYSDVTFSDTPNFVITEGGKNANVLFSDLYGKFTSYDISFEAGGEKVQPNGKVKIRVPLPQDYSTESTVLCHIDDSGNITYLDFEYENVYIVFETDHFSEYVIIDKASLFEDEPETDEPTTENPDTPENSDAPDENDCSCNCHKSGFMGFIWKILRFFYKLFKTNPVCDCGVKHY